MLHLKLPKKRVAHALMARAAMLDSLAANMQLNTQSNRYAKTVWAGAAARLREWARAAQVSTGDVYVSTELWSQIEGYYDG